eukprot:183277_1
MMSILTILSLLVLIHQTNTQTVNCNGDCSCPASSSVRTCTLKFVFSKLIPQKQFMHSLTYSCIGMHQCLDATLKCRADDPCIVTCAGGWSCRNTEIDASAATDVSITCRAYE